MGIWGYSAYFYIKARWNEQGEDEFSYEEALKLENENISFSQQKDRS